MDNEQQLYQCIVDNIEQYNLEFVVMLITSNNLSQYCKKELISKIHSFCQKNYVWSSEYADIFKKIISLLSSKNVQAELVSEVKTQPFLPQKIEGVKIRDEVKTETKIEIKKDNRITTAILLMFISAIFTHFFTIYVLVFLLFLLLLVNNYMSK